MNSLQDHAYQVHAQNLSVAKKRRLITQLEADIESEYAKWADVLADLLDYNNLGVMQFGFRVCDQYEAYGLSKKCGVLRRDIYKGPIIRIAFYITNAGEIGVAEWDNNGGPPRLSTIQPTCIDGTHYCDKTKKALRMFVETHPDLK